MKLKPLIIAAAGFVWAFSANAADPSRTLPILYINTENQAPVVDKENYVKATYYLDPCGTEGVEALGTVEAPLPLHIRGRGNYTWSGFDKKPYRLKLDKKAGLLSMNASKHWALLAHADDNQGFMRNVTGFGLSQLIGMAYTPAHQPCEVVLNGDYIGLYFLTETVRVAGSRVNVYDWDTAVDDWIKAQKEAGLPGKTLADYMSENAIYNDYTTGGWLVEIDNYDELSGGEQIHVDTKQQHSQPDWNGKIMVTFDSPCDYITDAQKSWLSSEFSAIDEMIFASDKNDCAWAEKVDLTSLAKFFIVNQLVGNYESFHGSCKMWHEKGDTEKWHFGPVWDFGSAFQEGHDMTRPIWESDYIQHWIEEMYKFPEFEQEVKRVYAEFMDSGKFDEIYVLQSDYANRIKEAAKKDRERWSYKGYGNDDVLGKLQNVQSRLRTSVSAMNTMMDYQGEISDEPSSDIYLRGGNFGSWSDGDSEYKFVKNSNGIYELHVNNLTGEWKLGGIKWNEGNVDFGGATNIALNTPTQLTAGGGNCTVAGGSANNVTLLFDWKTKKLTIKGEVQGGDDDDMGLTRRVYFKNSSVTRASSWMTPHVYTWSPKAHGEWPGTAMTETEINGEQYWTNEWTVENADQHKPGTACLKFNNGEGADTQPSDQVYYHNQVYNQMGASDEALSGITDVVSDSEAAAEFYTLQGIRVSAGNLPAGIYIMRRGNQVSKVLVK